MKNIKDIISIWKNDTDSHIKLHNDLKKIVDNIDYLNEHRTFIENNIFGFGERSFQYVWKLIVDELPSNFKFLEIGVFKGQILSLIRILSNKLEKNATIVGVTELSSIGGVWESNYKEDIKYIHDKFSLSYPLIIEGNSTNVNVINKVEELRNYDCIYIDGGHDFQTAYSDIFNYSSFLKVGGYLVIDDSCNDMIIERELFPGIQEVTDALNKFLSETSDYEFLFSVVHLKVFKKIK